MILKLNFTGKDSVPYKEEIEVPDFVGEALKDLMKSKKKDDRVFSAGEQDVNEFLRECLPFCTAKLFRTAYGTKLIAEELQAHPCNSKMTDEQKKAVYNNAALAVSKKLNHQKNVSKSFDGQMEKLDERIKKVSAELKERIKKTEEQLTNIDATLKKLNVDKKKYSESIKKLKEKKIKIKESLNKRKEQLEKLKETKSFKKETKNIAINTAKTNYSSPKIAFSFCKKNNIPISTVYSKALAEKFDWAADVDEDYYLNYPNND